MCSELPWQMDIHKDAWAEWMGMEARHRWGAGQPGCCCPAWPGGVPSFCRAAKSQARLATLSAGLPISLYACYPQRARHCQLVLCQHAHMLTRCRHTLLTLLLRIASGRFVDDPELFRRVATRREGSAAGGDNGLADVEVR